MILKRPKEVRGSLSNVVASHATGENAFLIEGFKSDIRECSAVFGRRRARESNRRRARGRGAVGNTRPLRGDELVIFPYRAMERYAISRIGGFRR